MSRGDKLLERMRANPRDWRIQDVITLCEAETIACTPPSGGSHYKVKHVAVERILTIPSRRPIKPGYIRDIVAFVDEVREKSK